MSKTSPTVKDRYNRKRYDRLNIFIPKGRREDVRARAAADGTNINAVVNAALRVFIGVSEDEWKRRPADLDDDV